MNQNDLKYLRIWIVVNYISLLSLIPIYWYLKISVENEGRFVILVLPVTVLMISYYFAFVRTKLWKFTHTSISGLDEREVQVLYKSLRTSYTIFVIFTVAVLYFMSVTGLNQINVMIASGLLYFAHILPSSVLGWKKIII